MPSITFAKFAIDIQSSIWFSKKKYFDYLPPLNIESLFITPNDNTEVSSLNQDKSDGPKTYLSNWQSFSTNHFPLLFPSILKTRKIFPMYIQKKF